MQEEDRTVQGYRRGLLKAGVIVARYPAGADLGEMECRDL